MSFPQLEIGNWKLPTNLSHFRYTIAYAPYDE